MTFICNARFVMDYVKAYLDAVKKHKDKKQSEWEYSSCAGIAFSIAHYPFAERIHWQNRLVTVQNKKFMGQK